MLSTFAFVARQGEHVSVILRGQVRSQPAHCEERHPSLRQVLGEHRKAPHRPRRLDTVVGGVLGEVEHIRAVLEERRVAFREVQATLVEFREVHNERDGRLPFALRRALRMRVVTV